MSDRLLPDQYLDPNQSLVSANGFFTFVYQGDGNLVLYRKVRDGSQRWLWDSQTDGKPAGRCIMQGDGNLVIQGPSGDYLWDTATDNNPGSHIWLANNGHVFMVKSDGTYPIWNTPFRITGPSAAGYEMYPGEVLYPDESLTSKNGLYTLTYKKDGNLVLMENTQGRRLWESGTTVGYSSILTCWLNRSGLNLVAEAQGRDHIYWLTGVSDSTAHRLVVQGDGNVVIYSDNTPMWATNTVQDVTVTVTDASQAAWQLLLTD